MSGLWIYDITDPLNGQLLGVFDTSETYPYRIALSDTFAAVTYWLGGSLKVISVADPANPYLVTEHGGSCTGIAWHNSLAYVVFQNRFEILNMTDAAHPSRVGYVPISHTGRDLTVDGSLVYGLGRCLTVLDGTGPGDLELLGLLELEDLPVCLGQDGTLALVATLRYPDTTRLDVIGLSDPLHPRLLGSVALRSGRAAVVVRDTLGFVATDSGLVVYDLSEPQVPQVAGSLRVSMTPRRMTIQDNVCFIGGSRIWSLDIGDPANPVLLGDTSIEVDDLVVKDTLLYVVPHCGGQLNVYSVADPGSLRELARIQGRNAICVAVCDTLLVTGGVNYVEVFSIADPADPVHLGITYVPENSWRIVVQADTVYTSHIRRYRLVVMPSGIELERIPTVRTAQLRVWPVPANRVLNIESREPVVLFDASGRRVLNLSPGENDVHHLAPGVYFVRQPDRRTTTKVILQK